MDVDTNIHLLFIRNILYEGSDKRYEMVLSSVSIDREN